MSKRKYGPSTRLKSLNCLNLCVGLIWGCLAFGQGPEKVEKTGPKWMQVEVAQEHLGQTFVLLGKLEPQNLSLLMKDGSIQSFPLPFEKQESSATPPTPQFSPAPPSSSDLSVPSVNYAMTAHQIRRCERTQEFKTFLSQLSLFKGLFYEMELTASSRDYAECASRLAQEIIAKGFKVSVTFGNLKAGGGINVRAYLGQAASDTPTTLTGETATALGLTARIGPYRTTAIRLLKDGYFILSFSQQPPTLFLDVNNFGKTVETIKLDELPRWNLGESAFAGFGVQTVFVKKSYADNLRVEEIPESVLQAAVDERLAYLDQYRWSLRNQILMRKITGTGLSKSEVTEYIPFDIRAQYILNDRFEMGFRLLPELYVGDEDAVKTNYMSAGLSYAVFGLLKRHFRETSKFIYQVGLNGFYLQNRGETADRRSVFLLSDLLGIALTNKLAWQVNPNWTLRLGLDFVPLPESQAAKSSLSTLYSLELERCIGWKHCFSTGWSKEAYELDYINFGAVRFETNDLQVGYKYLFQ